MDQPFSGVLEAQNHMCHMWVNFVPQNLTPSKFTLICDLWYSFDRVQSPDHFGMSIFEIVKN